MNKEWARFNKLNRRQDELYHQFAVKAKISDSQFWVLYALCENGGSLNQRSFCDKWSSSKQTVNAAVAGLQKSGLICLEFAEGSRKQKEIRLSEQGEEFVQHHILPVMEAECEVIMTLDEKQRTQFMDTMDRLLELMEEKRKSL